jgi:predicted esterase
MRNEKEIRVKAAIKSLSNGSVLLASTLLLLGSVFCAAPAAQEDVADIASEECLAGKDESKLYLLMEPREGAGKPDAGHPLLLVLPGGGGGVDFHPFVKRIVKHALPEDFVVAQLVSIRWTPEQTIVWPTEKNRVPKMKFSTEEYAEAVIKEVKKKHKIDPRKIFTLSWSSSGPAAYALSLRPKSKVTGSFVAMSIYKPELLPSRKGARGKAYYIYHSKEDTVCRFSFAEKAVKELDDKGASVKLAAYEGGHGWRGNVYGSIRTGIAWLEEAVAKKDKK